MRRLSLTLVIALHVFWLFLILFSLPLVFIYPGYNKIALVIVGFTILVQLIFWSCPLTKAENRLRGEKAYSEKTFLGHYLRVIFGFKVSDWTVDVMTAGYFVALVIASLLKI